MPEVCQLLVAPTKACHRIHEDGTGAECVKEFLLAADETGHGLDHSLPSLTHPSPFLSHIRNHPLCGIGRRRGAIVSNQVQDGAVRFVADRAHHRRAARGNRSNQALIREREKVLHRATATSNDDHLNIGMSIELLHGVNELFTGLWSLHQRITGDYAYRRPPPSGVLDHITLGCTTFARHKADRSGKKRKRLLSSRVEQSLGLKQALSLLEPRQQATLANRSDGIADEYEAARALEVGRFEPGNHSRALGQRSSRIQR